MDMRNIKPRNVLTDEPIKYSQSETSSLPSEGEVEILLNTGGEGGGG